MNLTRRQALASAASAVVAAALPVLGEAATPNIPLLPDTKQPPEIESFSISTCYKTLSLGGERIGDKALSITTMIPCTILTLILSDGRAASTPLDTEGITWKLGKTTPKGRIGEFTISRELFGKLFPSTPHHST
jgi:hypothetical protein